MDGIMHGVGFSSGLKSDTVYAYDYFNLDNPSLKPVIDLSDTPGHLNSSGLISTNKDTLYVLTSLFYPVWSTTRFFHSLFCWKYRISKTPNKQSGAVDVTAKLVSTSNYFLKDVRSIEDVLPVLSEKKKHRPRGKKKKKRTKGTEV